MNTKVRWIAPDWLELYTSVLADATAFSRARQHLPSSDNAFEQSQLPCLDKKISTDHVIDNGTLAKHMLLINTAHDLHACTYAAPIQREGWYTLRE
jgi:hypothetical protein